MTYQDPTRTEIRKPAQSARQGRAGRPVLAVLVAALLLAVGAFAVLALINSGEDMATLGAIETPAQPAAQ
ncbi:hypothetical protein [Roseibium aestuarii]|uniref:Uncharacterized protein n=1 Tax=Roseibium aestuarii TaxID=2600299 RepID=A0ABW4JYX1_9HYPH|nr:hypothetical protein [Roseibium aestuarii]